MPILLIAGLASLVLGLVLFFVWFAYIVAIVKALLPAAFIGAGAVAAYLGWEEMKDQKNPNIDFSSSTEADRYKAEAVAYQEKINEIADTPENGRKTEAVLTPDNNPSGTEEPAPKSEGAENKDN